jgi:acyl-CoA reductase-like NAD-dependent aldehyde dehydrogenase
MQGRRRHTRHACRGCRSEIRGEVAYEAEFFRWFSQAGSTVMRPSMELGGNAPFNVCANADLDRAVEGALGQLKVGDGMEAGIDVGPMIDAAGLEKVQRLVDDAVSRGAGILTADSRPTSPATSTTRPSFPTSPPMRR